MIAEIRKKTNKFKRKLFNRHKAHELAFIETAATYSEISGCCSEGQPSNIVCEIRVELSNLSDPNKIKAAVADKLIKHFGVSRITFWGVSKADDKIVQIYDRQIADAARDPIAIRLSDYLTEICIQKLQAGNVITVNLVTRSRNNNDEDLPAAIEIETQIMVPFISGGNWKYLLVAQKQSYSWPAEELKLLYELAEILFQSLERAYAEEALQHSEAWLRLAIEAANIYTWDIDLTTREIRTSANAYAIRGFPVEPTIDRYLETVHPADLSLLVEKINYSLTKSVPFEIEFRKVNPQTGEIIWLRLEGRFILSKGKANRLIGVTQNISARKKTEEMLASDLSAMTRLHDVSTHMATEGDLTRLLQEVLDAAIVIASADMGTLKVIDPESGALLIRAHRGLAKPFLDFCEAGHEACCGVSDQGVREDRRIYVQDVAASSLFAEQGQSAAFQEAGIGALQCTSLLARSGQLIGVLSTYWRSKQPPNERLLRLIDLLARQAADLIERKQAEEALKKSEERYRALAAELCAMSRRKDEFLGILSHEIRNPLASIVVCLSLLDRAAPGGEQARQAREILGRQALQLSRLVDDLLDVTRITQNRIILQKEPVELNKLVHRITEDYLAFFLEKGVALEEIPAPNKLYVLADPARLSQIIGNLLHNAVKFTEKGGYARVTLTGDELRQCAVIRVEDSGIGMEQDLLKNLFMPFMQADTTLDHSSGGLGLGLALVRGLTQLHGGTVSAHSDGDGKGSVFTISLPIAAEIVPVDDQGEPGSSAPARSRRVLIIEDIRDVADTFRSLLEEEGHAVVVAYDGFEGMIRAREFHPEILLCDIGLPGMNGYEVARSFCSDENLHNVYLISLTGYARPEDQQKAKEAGFHRHLSKPVNPAKLKEVLAQIE